MKKRFNLSLLLKNFSDIFSSVPENFPFKKELLDAENSWINKMALFHYTAWPFLTSGIFFFLMGAIQKSKPLMIYRFGTTSLLILLGIIAYLFREQTKVVKNSLFFASAVLTLSISWSLTVGNPTESIWVILLATIIIATISSSLFFAISWLTFLTLISEPFWITKYPTSKIVVNLVVAFVIIIFAHIAKRILVQSIVNKLLHDKSQKDFINAQKELYTEIEKFVPPVLVKKIEEQTMPISVMVNDDMLTGNPNDMDEQFLEKRPLSLVVDDILRRHQSDVAVLFSDLRNFSQRSTDIEFVEKELVPSSIKLIDMVEANMGVAKQIGDAIFVYYSTEGSHPDDSKKAILRAFKDAVAGCLIEKQRVKKLGRDKSERFFSIAYGTALIGNMASSHHREATVIGAPANLAARMDSLTKEPVFKPLLEDGNKILVCDKAKTVMDEFEGKLVFEKVVLEDIGITIKSFPDEKFIYLFHVTKENIEALNEILIANDIDPIDIEDYI